MELPKDWVKLQSAYEEEQEWRNKGELAIRQEMERRLVVYFRRKAEAAEVARVAGTLPPPRPRLVDMGTTGHMNAQNRQNRDRAAAGLPRQRDLNQMRRQAEEQVEDIRRWRNLSSR
jgi:hypothetical protein